MEPQQESPPLTPRRKRGLVLVIAIILALVVLIFVGMNLGHYKQAREGEPAGTTANVSGPDSR